MNRFRRHAAGALILACVAAPAYADDVLYKCIDGKGAVSIQSSPCPKTSKEAWKRDTAAMAAAAGSAPMPTQVTAPPIRAGQPPPRPPGDAGHPGPPPPPPAAVQSLAPAAVESLAPIGPGPTVGAAAPATAPDPCSQAKDLAAQLRDMPWLDLSSDQQQRLMGWVMQQCRQGQAESR